MEKKRNNIFRLFKMTSVWTIVVKVIRIIIKAFNGLIFGNFLALLDKDALKEEWGEIGKLLALMKEDPPESIDRARLGDVIKSLPYLVSAAKVELED